MAERLIRNHPQMVSLFHSTVKCRECEIFIGTGPKGGIRYTAQVSLDCD